MKASVVTFPGSNCDKDIGTILEEFYNIKVNYIWHKESIPSGQDLVVLPGGFSYGDYLRCGAMARFSPAMESVIDYANKGGKVLGICNGFQVLTESGLLPGALTSNLSLKYICEDVEMSTSSESNNYWKDMTAKNDSKFFTWPIAHGEGRYFADKQTLDSLEDNGLVLAYYKDNPNGSERNIAGISSPNKKVVGMMPHPERAMNPYTGPMDGKLFFDYFLGI